MAEVPKNSAGGIEPKDASMWAVSGEAYFPCEKVEDRLPPGQYTIEVSQNRGLYFNKTKVTLDGLINLPDAASERVLAQIESFWKNKQRYIDMNVLHKRGFLLWGPPGSGKTTTIQQVAEMIVKRQGLAIYVKDPEIASKGLEILRRVEPDRPIVVMMEDIESMMGNRAHDENHLLSLLDGELQIENVVYIGSTNYPERLPPRLVNRPSRFDVIQKIDMPNEASRASYLKYKRPQLAEEPYPDQELSEKQEEIAKRVDAATKKVNKCEQELNAANTELEKAEDDISRSKASKNVSRAESQLTAAKAALQEIDQELENLKEDRTLLDYWVENTENLSIAHLKELVIAVYCFEQPFEENLSRWKRLAGTKLTSKSSGEGINI